MSQGVTPKTGSCHRGVGSRDTWVGQLPPAHPPPCTALCSEGSSLPMEEQGHTQAHLYPLLCPPSPSPLPSPATSIPASVKAGGGLHCLQGTAPCQKPPLHGALPMPALCPCPNPAEVGTAAAGPGDAGLPGRAATRTLLYFPLLFLVNKALDMLGGCQGPWPGDGSSGQHPQPCPPGTGTPTPQTRLSHQCHTACLFNPPLPGTWCPHGYCIQRRDASESCLQVPHRGEGGERECVPWGALGTRDQWKRGRRRAGRSRARGVLRMPGPEFRWRHSV